MDADYPREKNSRNNDGPEKLESGSRSDREYGDEKQRGILYEGEGEAIYAGLHFQKNRLRSPSSSRSGSSDAADDNLSFSDMDNLSPNAGIDSVTCPRPLCSSSPLNSSFTASAFDSSNTSIRDPSGFEGEGGNLSVLDPIMLQTEIHELRYQNSKLHNEITDLKHHISVADDAQQVLQNANEELEKKLSICKAKCEKLKHISKELEEAKSILAGHEDKTKVLVKRIERLERDTLELSEENSSLKDELTTVRSQLDHQRTRNFQLEKEMTAYKVECGEKVQVLLSSKADLEEKCKSLSQNLIESNEINEDFRKENRELENRLAAVQEKYMEPERESYLDVSCDMDGECSVMEQEMFLRERACTTPVENSIHAEITASMIGNTSLTLSAQFRHDSLINCESSGTPKPWTLDSYVEYPYPTRCKLMEILEFVLILRQEWLESSRIGKEGENQYCNGSGLNGEPGSAKTDVVRSENDVTALNEDDKEVPNGMGQDVDVVRRIQDELAEFRVQLKKSQEIFTAFNSSQSFTITKSCPLLLEENPEPSSASTLKPGLQSSSTQTEESVITVLSHPLYNHSSTSMCENPNHSIDEALSRCIEGLSLDDNELDRLSGDDDDSIQLSLGLPTVEEESEQETEPSPDTIPRGMNSDRIHRRKLRRMPNMNEDPGSRSDNGTHSPDFHSARESTISYNSIERPLQVSGGGNGPCEIFDAASASDNDTTFGSPITSPSSPSYYYTPSQGSSSQETLTNHDGDRTPVNDYHSGDDAYASSPVTSNLSSSPLRKRNRPIESLMLPIDEVSQDPSTFKGVVDENDKSRMTRYAYDPIQRSVDPKAKVLPRSDWRGLRRDLTDQEMEKYNKTYAQEEGGEGDVVDANSGPSRGIFDLDDEAEKTLFETGYPKLAEQLFLSLESYMKAEVQGDLSNKLTKADVEKISRRFTELSMTFKSDHATLDKREKRSKSELEFAEGRVKANIDLLERCKGPQDLESVGKAAEELEQYTQKLVKKAKEVGRIDLEKRMYKMIEVMTMYVHILRNFENPDRPISPGNSQRITNGKDAEGSTGSNGLSPSGSKSKESRVGDLGEGQWMRELSWPWNWEQSVKGVQRCFSIILMLAGLVILIQSVFPSANAEHCAPSSISPLISVLEKYSSLVHNERPTL